MDQGDIYVADLNEERRRRVLVVSSSKFSSSSGRAIVVPELVGPVDEVLDPWRVEMDGCVFAVDQVRSIAVRRLLERTGRASNSATNQIRRALRAIT